MLYIAIGIVVTTLAIQYKKRVDGDSFSGISGLFSIIGGIIAWPAIVVLYIMIPLKKILKFQKHNQSYFITREGAHVVVGSVKPLSDNFLASYETADHRGYQPKLSIKDMKKPLIRS